MIVMSGPLLIRLLCAGATTLLVAGCGGTASDDVDARVSLDALPGVDGATTDDANSDASAVDGGGEATSYLYYWGDFDSNSLNRVALVEFPTGTKTTMALAGLAAVEIEGVAVAPDKTKIAVAGRKAAGNAPVINIYAADGSDGPTTAYTGSQDTDFEMLSYSPDGSMVAFLADIDLNNSMALYVVPAAGGAAPKLVSLTPVSIDQFVYSYKWAANSSHIAFTGDLQTDTIDGLWTVDVTVETPSPVAIVTLAELTATDGLRDVDDVIDFDATGRLYFRSDHEVANDQFRLYRCDLDGSNRGQVPGTNLTNSGGAAEAAAGPFAISDTGSTLAFFSESPEAGLYQVYVMPLSGAEATLVSSVTTDAGDSSGPDSFALRPLVWSPDESRLAVIADWPVDGGDQPDDFAAYILPVSPPAAGVRVLKPSATDGDVLELAFTADSSRLVIRADVLDDDVYELFATSDFTTADQGAAIRLEEVPPGGDIWGFVTPR